MSDYVLIVDDEEMIRTFILKVLEINKINAVCTESGEKALEVFKESSDQFSLALVDMSLPGISGIQLIDQMRKIKPDLKIGLMSGYDQGEMSAQCGDIKIDSFIHKPFRMNELMSLVSPLL